MTSSPLESDRRRADHVTAWPVDNDEAVAALMLYTGPVENRKWDWFEAVGVVETIVRHQLAADFERMAGNRNPADPEGSAAYSRWATNAADRIRHPERYGGCAAGTSLAGGSEQDGRSGTATTGSVGD